MSELLEKTLSQIVTEHHQAARVFEKYGLDFCCKGKRPLKDACSEKNILSDALVAELNQAFTGQDDTLDFNKLSLTELAAYIIRVHHTYVKLNAPQIFHFLLKVASKHGERYPHMVSVYEIFGAVQSEFEDHMAKEERILFPRIMQLEMQGLPGNDIQFLQSPIDIMEHDHDLAGEQMAKIRELTNNYEPPADACTTHRVALAGLKAFEEDLHQHVHLENNILFPKALEAFSKLQGALN